MTRAMIMTMALVSSLTLATFASAQPAPTRSGMVVSTAWLVDHLNDANLVVLHVGTRAQYDSGHVAGARLVTLNDVSLPTVKGGLSLQMAAPAALRAWASAQGIGDRSRVVVVAHDGSLPAAARVVLSLAVIGMLDRTSLLDGSFQAWKSEGRVVSTATPGAAPSVSLSTDAVPAVIASMSDVEDITLSKASTIVDARLPRFYNGDGGGYPRAGHVPTAVNVPYSSLSTNGFLKPASELRALLSDAGVTNSKPVVAYCHIGQQASMAWFVATFLGYNAKLFDGSFQEWSGTEQLPVIGPPDPLP